MKKKVFGALIDPEKLPGCESRLKNHSLDTFFGDAQIEWPQEKLDFHGIDHKPERKYKTNCLPQTLPSVILRRKGKRV